MKPTRVLLLAALATLPLAAPAGADAAFGPTQTLDLPVGGPLSAAVVPDGRATVAGLRSASSARIEVATRPGPDLQWRIGGFATSARAVRDLQVVAGNRATVLAWSEARRRSQVVVVATADAGGHLTVRGRVPVVDAFSAFPRLAALRSGSFVLAWRDGRTSSRARVRVATFDGERFTSAPRTVGTDASQIVVAVRGAGAAVGWISAHRFAPRKSRLSVRRVRPRTLTLRVLDARGLPAGAAILASRDAGATARLAGAPDGRLVASWLRPQKIPPYPGEERGDAPPPSAFVSPVAFTRQLLPAARPARPLDSAGQIAGSVPTVAFDAPDHAVAALRVSASGGGPVHDALLEGATEGGPWSSPQAVAELGFSLFDPVVAAPASGPLIVYSAFLPDTGPARWAVAASDAAGPQVLGTTDAANGRGIAVARTGDRVLVAWPSLTGGVQVAERG